jgi:small-conductance mechanosensitive channel
MICLAGVRAPAALAGGVPSTSVVQAGEEGASLRRSLEAAQAAYRQVLTADGPPTGATREEVLERNHLMGELVASLQHTLEATERLPDLRRRVAAQEMRTREWTAFPNPPPYSILLADQLRTALDTASYKAQAADARAGLLRQQEAEGEQRHKAAEIAKRQSEERATQVGTTEQRDRHLWLVDLASLRSRAAAASLEEARALRAVTAAEADEQRELVRLLERQVATARKTANFSQTDLDLVLAELDRRRTVLEKQADQSRTASQRSRQALVTAQQALTRFKADPAAGGAGSDAEVRLDVLQKTEELRRLQADNADLAAEVARRTLDVHAWERTGWQLRWLLLNSGDRDKLRDTLSEVDQLVHRLQTWKAYLDSEIARTPGQDNRFTLERVASLSPEQSVLATQGQAAQRDRVEILRNGQQAIADLLRTLSIWRQDFLARGADRATSAIARDVADDLLQGLRVLWQFEIFSVEDTLEIDGRKVVAARSVTVGKSVGAILFLVAGYFTSSWISRRLGRFAVRRLNAGGGHASMISRWLHFMLLAMLGITVLHMVNIPLTVFAFLGGALAIGLGFGTQVLLKNLVSGLMLLVERPLRVGDRVEVGTVVGWVTDIGVRSSTIRTNEGIEILVPNSTFIENNVTNWTYSNAAVRRSVKVGVEYGASPDQVRDLLLQVCARHDEVLADPEPRVLFEDFGTDALIFNLQYWIVYSQGNDGAQVASDLRFMIKRSLAEAGIGIPFPQRVIHFAPGASTPSAQRLAPVPATTEESGYP